MLKPEKTKTCVSSIINQPVIWSRELSIPNVTTIELPSEIVQKISEKIKGSEFHSVSEYVLFVLREVLEEDSRAVPYSKEDEERIQARLRELGYV